MRDPADKLVSEATRRFEEEDEQVFAGAGRGPTPAEAAAAERYGEASPNVAAAHREMREIGRRHRGEGRIEL